MQKAFQTIEKYHMIQPGDRVLAGVSGGADSVCLLFTLLEYRKKVSFDIKAVHVEHGIRGEESRQDAVYVEALCQKQNVEYECVSVDIPAMAVTEKLSTEEAGRLARYQIFEEISKSWHADKIAVAHNQNDQAETIVWNLARGSGLDGAAGIRPVRDRIIRPLLECSRPEIEAYLKQKSITWREDRTNQELDYTRNIIRNCLLPEMAEKLNTGTIQHLAQFGTEMQQTREFLQELVEEACQKIARVRPGQVQIDLHQMKKEKEFLQERIIRFCMKEAGCGLKDIQRTHIQSVRELMEKQSGRQIQLPGGWLVRRTFDQLVIEQDAGKNGEIQQQKILLKIPGETQTPWGTFTTKIIFNENQSIPQKKYTKWLSYDKITTGICLRTRQSGDFLIVNRQGGHKKLKSYFTDEKIPAEKRNQIPLLTVEQEVIWITGYRISEGYKVEKNTKEILEITYKEAVSWQKISES